MPEQKHYASILSYEEWFYRNKYYRKVRDLFVLSKAGQYQMKLAPAKIAKQIGSMRDALLKSGSVNSKAIAKLNWKRSKPVPKSQAKFTALYTPRLLAIYDQEAAQLRELVVGAVSAYAVECNQIRSSLIESTQAVAAHQATFLEHCNQAEKYTQRLLSRSELTGTLMKQFSRFDKWRTKWQKQHVELLSPLEALKK